MPVAHARNGRTPPPVSAGFSMPPRVVEFEFPPESEYHGAVVRCRRKLTLEDGLAFQRAFRAEEGEELADADAVERARRFGELVLLDWNLLDEDGAPLAATPDNLIAQPADFLTYLLTSWIEQFVGVPRPLPSPSSAGAPSAVPSETTAAS